MPGDPSKMAKKIIDLATSDEKLEDEERDDGKDPAAVALGRKGGLKGGKARAANMTAEKRSKAALKAAKARWGKPETPTPPPPPTKQKQPK